MLITLRVPIVTEPSTDHEDLDPEQAFRAARRAGWDDDVAAAWAAWTLGLPTSAGEAGPIRWTMRDVRHLRSMRVEYAMGNWPDDRDPEPGL